MEEIIGVLQSTDTPLTRIPEGLKENAYFVVTNKDNLAKRDSGKCSEYYDDCGAWNSKDTSCPTNQFVSMGSTYKKVYFKLYSTAHRSK